MTEDGWRELVRCAVDDPERLDLLAQLLAEQDEAKNRLKQAGFGVIGTPWPEIVDEVLKQSAAQEDGRSDA